MKQEMIRWQWHQLTIGKSFASCYRRITTPASNHSLSYWLDGGCSFRCRINSVKALWKHCELIMMMVVMMLLLVVSVIFEDCRTVGNSRRGGPVPVTGHWAHGKMDHWIDDGWQTCRHLPAAYHNHLSGTKFCCLVTANTQRKYVIVCVWEVESWVHHYVIVYLVIVAILAIFILQ